MLFDISERPNVPCSAERSVECSVILGQFSVPLFNEGTRKVKTQPGKKEPPFLAFLQKKISILDNSCHFSALCCCFYMLFTDSEEVKFTDSPIL